MVPYWTAKSHEQGGHAMVTFQLAANIGKASSNQVVEQRMDWDGQRLGTV